MYKPSIFNIPFGEGGLYNSYTGAIIKLPNTIEECITSNDSLELLYKQGFIVDAKMNELNRLAVRRKTAIYSKYHQVLKYVIALTNDCQAHCTYCFEHGINRNHFMNENTVEMVIKYIKGQAKENHAECIRITYFGGEPLLNIKAIERIGTELKEFCEKENIRLICNIITNGIGLTPDVAEMLKDIHVSFAQITLDGPREAYKAAKGIDAYDTVISNIKSVVDILPIDIRLNVTRNNQKDIIDVIEELLVEHNLVGRVQMTLAQVVDYVGCEFNSTLCLDAVEYANFVRGIYLKEGLKKEGNFKRIVLLPKVLRTFCGMENCTQYVIGPDGELYKCEHSVGKPDEIVGDVYTGSYYSDMEMDFYSEIPEKCMQEACKFLPMCLGGCANERLHKHHIRDCEQVKEKHLLLLKTYLELVEK